MKPTSIPNPKEEIEELGSRVRRQHADDGTGRDRRGGGAEGEVVEVPDRRPAVFDGVITTKARFARSAPSW